MEPFLGEIRLFAGNFAPYGWHLCDGTLLPIGVNTALFSLLGTQFGGDGKTTFGLPDLRGRVPIGQGAGPGLTPRDMGDAEGEPTVALILPDVPLHTHLSSCGSVSSQPQPEAAVWGATGRSPAAYAASPSTLLNPTAVQVAGGSQPHNNRQPYLGMTYIIALMGVFPPRS